MSNLIDQFSAEGIISVIKIDDAAKAVSLAKALRDGGVFSAEVTFRTAAAESAIKKIADCYPDMLIGAGTILNVEQCKSAIGAGSKFIVTPGYSQEIVDYCTQQNVCVIPGCANATDIMKAVNSGLKVVKMFPAEQLGGIDYIKALAPVFPGLKFLPTGGVNAKNLNNYLGNSHVLACGGSWMAKADMIEREDYGEISKICRQAIVKMLDFRLVHVAKNMANESAILDIGEKLSELFGFGEELRTSPEFAESLAEAAKGLPLCSDNTIAVSTSSIPRAVNYLKRFGVAFDENMTKVDEENVLCAVCLKSGISNSSVQLVQR